MGLQVPKEILEPKALLVRLVLLDQQVLQA